MPKLSVIVPVYNADKTLKACLESIRKSKFKDYELIVIDDGSVDGSLRIAQKCADKVISLPYNQGRVKARNKGVRVVNSPVVVNIDSDVVIKPDTLMQIDDYFHQHAKLDAITGMLAIPDKNYSFVTDYKNCYMNYYFSILPKEVSFLYGSIFAIRERVLNKYKNNSVAQIADDTEIGQRILTQGHQIHLLKSLQVIHLKTFTIWSLIKNDWQIPYDWAKIFLKFQGWKQLGKYHTGYAHAAKSQIVSLLLVPNIWFLLLLSLFVQSLVVIPLVLILGWLMINRGFFIFLYRKKGLNFLIPALIFTFLDHLVMFAGVMTGSIVYFITRIT